MISRSIPIACLLLLLLMRHTVEIDAFIVSSDTGTRRITTTTSMTTNSPSTPLNENNNNERKPFLVCTTASSLEGTAFCRQVLKRGKFRITALTHNLDSPRSKALEDMGAELYLADNDDVQSLRRAFDGAHGVYGITTWSGATFAKDGSVQRDTSADAQQLEDAEVRQGQNIIEAALGTGREYHDKRRQHPSVKHFVLQSMHRGRRKTKSDYPKPEVEAPLHHKAKWRLEDALLTRMMTKTKTSTSTSDNPRWSILRQPTYLENFDNASNEAKNMKLRSLRQGVVGGLLDEDVPLTVIAVEDLGALASRMFEEKHALKYGNGGVLVAGSERVTGKELARMANQVCNDNRLDFVYRPIPWLVLNCFIPVEYPKQLKRWLSYGGNDEGIRLPKSCYNPSSISRSRSSSSNNEGDEDFLLECRRVYPGILSVKDWFVSRDVDQITRPPSFAERLAERIGERATQLVTLFETP